MNLRKHNYLISSTSSITLTDAQRQVIDALNQAQAANTQWQYAELFDSRTGELYRLYSDAAASGLGLSQNIYTLTGISSGSEATELAPHRPALMATSDNPGVSQQPWLGLARDGQRVVTDDDHLFASIQHILTTPIGSRVLRREYGSHLTELLGEPLNRRGMLRLQNAVATALVRWEPRFRLHRVQIDLSGAQGVRIRLSGETGLNRRLAYELTTL